MSCSFLAPFRFARDSLIAEHTERDIDLVHAHRRFALLKLAHESEPEPGAQSEFLLRQARPFALFLDKLSYPVHSMPSRNKIYTLILYPLRCNVKSLTIIYTR